MDEKPKNEGQDISLQLTPAEVGKMINLSPKHVINLSNKGELPAYKISDRSYRYSEAEIAEYIKSKKIGGCDEH